MAHEATITGRSSPPPALVGLVGVAALAVLLLGGLTWAKWLPYAGKVGDLALGGAWPDGSILETARVTEGAYPLVAAWHFTVAYAGAVWRALLVALLVGSAVEAWVPRRWLLAVLDRRTRLGQATAGGVLSTPSMMCTCCTSPVTVGLRRQGAPLASGLAYWLGNPLLNPAVLVFLLLVLPWQYAAVRLLVGAAVVVAGSAAVARWVEGRQRRAGAPEALPADPSPDARAVAELPGRYLRSLARTALVLVPEYLVVVYVVGLVSVPVAGSGLLERPLGTVALVAVAVVAAALVVPTGGEIPVVAAATAAGAGAGLAGVLLVALPAVSVPSAVMVGRALGWPATLGAAVAVVVGSLAAGALLLVLL